jgi:ribosomal protein L37AE/L43A
LNASNFESLEWGFLRFLCLVAGLKTLENMKTKNKQSKTNFGSSVNFEDNNQESFVKNIKGDTFSRQVPTCPMCGNKEMNYYLPAKKVWKCSKAHLHGNCLVVQETLKNVA